MIGYTIPQDNVSSYQYLFLIENTLREYIIKSLSNCAGSRWYTSRLPDDILLKYRNGRQYETRLKWYSYIPHHPIYYIDFPDLRKIIERKDNWADIFKDVFIRKDFVSNLFTELEYIRNKVAHNRKVTQMDVGDLQRINSTLIKCIGENEYTELLTNLTTCSEIKDIFKRLYEELMDSYNECKNLKMIDKLIVWHEIKDEWWFDDSYLGYPIFNIISYCKTIEEYQNLERTRGSGHKIESWVLSHDIEQKYHDAKIEIENLLE